MTFASFFQRAALPALALTAVASCGGSSTEVDSGADMAASDSGTTDGAVDSGTDAGIDSGATDGGIDAGTDGGGRVPANHRPDDSACTATAPPGNCSFGGGAGMCSADTDCTAGANGRCNMNLGGAVFCQCTYDTCAHDTDCATGETCACHGAAFHARSNECIAGNCRTDSGCGAGGYCSPTIGGCGGLAGYYCHTPSDLCLDDTDCASGTLDACEYVSTSMRWECVPRMFCP